MRFGLAAGLAGIALAQDPSSADFYRQRKEIALGARLAEEARQRTTPFESDVFHQYLADLGARLAAPLPEPRFDYTFTVIAEDPDGPAHEPLSFPGGAILVPAHLILETQDESEFAGMLAHAMAHCAEPRRMRPVTGSQGAVPIVFAGGWTGLGSPESLLPMAFRPLQRRSEIEADAMAAKAMAAAGYDPRALEAYLRRVGAPEERLTALRDAIRQLLPGTYGAAGRTRFADVRDAVRNAIPEHVPAAPRLLK